MSNPHQSLVVKKARCNAGLPASQESEAVRWNLLPTSRPALLAHLRGQQPLVSSPVFSPEAEPFLRQHHTLPPLPPGSPSPARPVRGQVLPQKSNLFFHITSSLSAPSPPFFLLVIGHNINCWLTLMQVSLMDKITHEEKRKVKVLVVQLCPALCNSMDCSSPGSSVRGILQARILE